VIVGFVYVVINPAWPDFVKIGKTQQSVEQRVSWKPRRLRS